MVALILLAAVAIPYRTHTDGQRVTFVGWLVVPSYREQRELHEDILAVISRRAENKRNATSKREMVSLLRAIPKSGGITDRTQQTATCLRMGRRCFEERQPTRQPEAGPR